MVSVACTSTLSGGIGTSSSASIVHHSNSRNPSSQKRRTPSCPWNTCCSATRCGGTMNSISGSRPIRAWSKSPRLKAAYPIGSPWTAALRASACCGIGPIFSGCDREIQYPIRELRSVMDFMAVISASIPAADALARFHPAVRTWFERRFPDGPTEAQAGGWPAVVEGRHTLICAPTGSGKTLAGFLAAIDALYHAHEAGEDIEGATQVVYLSPLKALAVDIH